VAGISQAGQLDRRITIRRATTAANAFNEFVEAWTDYATVWAHRHDVSAAEGYRAQEVGAEISARFTVRVSPVTSSIDARDRIAFGGLEYNITAVREAEAGRNRFREIDCVARAQRTDGYEEADSPPLDSP
jgi:SPP1 family predicted phage head-tail adaptor